MAATNQVGQIPDHPKAKLAKAKDPKRCTWRENFANVLLSGIEFRNIESNEIVHFITVQHKELHRAGANPFRVTVEVDEDGTFELPPKQTFDQMIQAKRRQQNYLYSSNHSTTTSSLLSDRAARRVSAAARRQPTLTTTNRPSSRRINFETPESPLRGIRSSMTIRRPKSKKKKKSRSSSSRSKSSKTTSCIKSEIEVSSENGPTEPSTSTAPIVTVPEPAMVTPVTLSVPSPSPSNSSPNKLSISKPFEVKTAGDVLPISANKAVHMISSMKELARQNPSLGSMDKKEIKRLLKSAPPGAALVLANGTVIKKSRRGGARAGAGRKRSRPLPGGQQSTSSNNVEAHQQDSRSSAVTLSTGEELTSKTAITNANPQTPSNLVETQNTASH